MELYGNLSKGVTFILLALCHVKRQLPQSVGQVVCLYIVKHRDA